MILSDYSTVKDAAKEIGIEYMALLQRIRRGKVKTERIGGRLHMISQEEVARLKAERVK